MQAGDLLGRHAPCSKTLAQALARPRLEQGVQAGDPLGRHAPCSKTLAQALARRAWNRACRPAISSGDMPAAMTLSASFFSLFMPAKPRMARQDHVVQRPVGRGAVLAHPAVLQDGVPRRALLRVLRGQTSTTYVRSPNDTPCRVCIAKLQLGHANAAMWRLLRRLVQLAVLYGRLSSV